MLRLPTASRSTVSPCAMASLSRPCRPTRCGSARQAAWQQGISVPGHAPYLPADQAQLHKDGAGTYLIGDQLADHQLGQTHDPLRGPSRVAAGEESGGSVTGFGEAGFEGLRSAAKSTGAVPLSFSMPQLLTAPPRTGRCWTSTASRSWTPAASTLSSPPTEPREAPGAGYDWQHPVPPSHASSRSSASGEGEAAGAGDPLARAETTAHTERAMQAKPASCEPAHRVIPRECETRIRDGPTGRRAGSRGRSRSVLHRRGGRSSRREGATRP